MACIALIPMPQNKLLLVYFIINARRRHQALLHATVISHIALKKKKNLFVHCHVWSNDGKNSTQSTSTNCWLTYIALKRELCASRE